MHVRRSNGALGSDAIRVKGGWGERTREPQGGDSVHSAARGYARPTGPGRRAAFSLIELLAVIAIMGLIAAMVGPTLAGYRKGDAMAAGTRQMLDAVARARQLAITERTTVYMVFVPANFWQTPGFSVATLSQPERTLVTNLVEKQFTGYTFLSLRSMGDQPGRYTPRFLSSWQNLPDGTFVPPWKFTYTLPGNYLYRITNPINGQFFDVAGFQTNAFPFPTEQSFYRGPDTYITLPYVAFNYLGQLSTADGRLVDRDEFIPLAIGSVTTPMAENRVALLGAGAPIARETPAWNSTNSFNLIHIDRLTGRARLERQEVK
jgi:prepilin-type N-terminal cleavage/methylation domain-containing protein